MLRFELIHPHATYAMLGLIPEFLDKRVPQSAKEQLDHNYAHGGGWHSFKGFKLNKDLSLSYPGDPPTMPIAKAQLGEETIVVYEHAWVAIIQPDGSFDVARMD